MRWSNVRVIFRRELRDQLRDRRTLFMILVLPMLLYPLMGLGAAAMTGAFEQKPRTVVVVGAERLPAEPPLLNGSRDGFLTGLFVVPEDAARLKARSEPASSTWAEPGYRRVALRRRLADAVVLVPADLKDDLAGNRTAEFEVDYDGADESGALAYRRVREVLETWGATVVRARLEEDRKPPGYTRPVRVRGETIATAKEAGVGVWARMFPFLLVMMAMTGAFYPAIDLCAGEKERGTMETLLISPAGRPEIVAGKFLTVVAISMATATLNLLSMGLTGLQLAGRVGGMSGAGGKAVEPLFGAPSAASAFWMLVLLVPLSAFFAAVSVGLALMARSMKEGQYYMTPLYMVALPLVFLTLTPGIDLDPFTSLVPITGASLLLRALLQGDYGVARRFFLPVLVPMLVYTWIALRWAVSQFEREDVLFRESEKFDLAAWLRYILRHKPATPDPAGALLCFVLMLTTAYYVAARLASDPLRGLVVGQVAFILGPPAVLALLFTARPGLTLRLARPRGRYLLMAVGLGVALNPLTAELRVWVEYLFPASDLVRRVMAELGSKLPDLGTALLLLAVIPAICEEVAFRGYILTGLGSGRSTASAVLVSAFLFGLMHALISLFQQFFNATLLGIVLGLLAVRSGSLWPGIVLHVLNNSLAILLGEVMTNPRWRPVASALFRDPARGLYYPAWVGLGAVTSAAMLAMLVRDPGRSAAESSTREVMAEAPSLDAPTANLKSQI